MPQQQWSGEFGRSAIALFKTRYSKNTSSTRARTVKTSFGNLRKRPGPELRNASSVSANYTVRKNCTYILVSLVVFVLSVRSPES